MGDGKLLFERLGQGEGWKLRSSIERSVQQLACPQYVRDRDLEPGVLNFGLPSLPDLGAGGGDLHRFAALLKERIHQFERRIEDAEVLVENGRLVVTGRLRDSDEPIRWWM